MTITFLAIWFGQIPWIACPLYNLYRITKSEHVLRHFKSPLVARQSRQETV